MGYDSANIIVTSGYSIPVPADVSQYNYIHTRISFKDIDILDADVVPVESNVSAMQKMFDGRTAVIYMDRIGADPSTGVNTTTFSIMSNASEKDISSIPTGMKTTDGSIIPHLILPDDSFKKADNGMCFDGDKADLPSEGGYVWIPSSLSGASCVKNNDGRVKADVKLPSTYGHRDFSGHEYVFNHDAKCAVDEPIIAIRKYTCQTEEGTISVGSDYEEFEVADAGKGAFALCYNVDQYEQITKDTVDARGSGNLLKPFVKFDIGARRCSDSATVIDPDLKTLVENNTKKISVTIRTNGEAEIRAGVDAQSGSFCPLENDMKPPQCVEDVTGVKRMHVMYLYPTYYGLVARNSISSDPKKQEVSEVVLKDSLKGVKSPWNNLTVIDGNGSAIDLDYAKEYLEKNPGSDLEFFPTTLHESSDYKSVSLKVNDGEGIRFNKNISVTWSRCLGRWAYCPLYFHRNLTFTLYFKGAYKKAEGQSSNFEYLLYPLVGIDSESSGGWTIGVSHGAGTCITASVVCTDDDKLETIYKAVFHFKSDKMMRMPVEVFGAELVLRRKEFQFTHKSGNGTFALCATTSDGNIVDGTGANIREQYSQARALQGSSKKYLPLITSLSLTTSMDGVSGTMELDGYPIEQGIGVLQQTQSVGEVDLGIKLGTSGSVSGLFSGYGFEIATAGSDSDYRMSVKLEGVQKKMSDMKLVCAPFWDGDRLEAICLYFEQYMKLKLKMIDHTVSNLSSAKSINTNLFTHSGNWVSEDAYTLSEDEESETGVNDNSFRVPRSFNWMSPAVNFQTGTPCLDALKKLGEFTSCVFCVGADGVGYFYELDEYGFPYYVNNQINDGYYVTFSLQEIVSISLAPSFENWYNSIATFGFIRKTTKEAALDPASKDAVTPGVNYTVTDSTLFPWSKHNVGVENGFLTKKQLKKVHNTRVRFAKARRSVGTVTVLGNTRVTHMYQVIRIADVYYYVTQISHSIDLGRKMWTTSYQIGYFVPGSDSNSSSSG